MKVEPETNLQLPPKVIYERDIPYWRAEWTKFLFGKEPLPDNKLIHIEEGRREVFRSIERLHLKYPVERELTTEAYLLRPKGVKGNLPGIVFFHESGPTAFEAAGSIDPSPETSIAARLAREKYVVICPKCFIYGERPLPAIDPRTVHRREVKKMQQAHPQWKGISRMIQDGIRAVDVLGKRYRAKTIGAIGHSLGAKEVLFLMAFESRVKAGVASDGGIGLTFSNWHDVWYLGQEIREEGFPLDNHQVLAMIAPRSFLLVGGKYDNDYAWPFIRGAMPLWKSMGSPKKIGWFRHDAGHRFPPVAEKEAFKFLKHSL